MHPSIHAKERPNTPAIIMAGSGEVTTYAGLGRAQAQLF